MKLLRSLLAIHLALLIYPLTAAHAQEEPGAAWQITRFDITVNASPNDRALTIRALVTARNVGRGAGGTITLRVSPKAEIKAASINEATANFRAGEVRNNLQPVRVTLPAPVAAGAIVKVALDYRLPVAENSGLAALSPAGSQFLPLSYWYPTHNTLVSLRGADVAPFRLSVNGAGGETVVASGKANGSVYEQSLNGQPFFITGTWDVSDGVGDAKGISAFMPKGASADERKRADELIALASSARAFYSGLLGVAPDAPIRLVAVRRGAGFNEAGTVLLDAAAIRRQKIDALSALLIAESVAKIWLGGVAPVRGDGSGVIREGLSRYLATLFFEKQYGREAADAERARERIAFAAIAKRDGPLSRMTPLDPGYFNSTANKGAMIWRLVERALGRDAFHGVVRASLQSAAGDTEGLTLPSVRAALVGRGDASLKSLLDQMLDQPTDMDLMIGVPEQKGGQWASALRNTGSVDAVVSITAVTASGERLATQATIPTRNFSETLFSTNSRIVRVEVDPEKLYPQVDYSNDIAPRSSSAADPLVDATTKFVKQDFAGAEAGAREMLLSSLQMQEARILLARSLLAQNKMDEAEKEFRAVLDERLPTPNTLAWGNIGLAEIALRRGQAAEASRRFNEAVRADAEYASTLNARLGRIKAEVAAKAAPAPDESARAFVSQLDQAIKSGRKADLDAVILPGELTTFSKGIVGSQPEAWVTQVVRTEQLDANRIAVDVSLNTKEFGREQAGTAVLILQRVGTEWKLAGIELFEVR